MTDVPAEPNRSTVTDAVAVQRVSDALWRGLDRHRGVLDVTEFGDVVLSLLYLRSLPSWQALASRVPDIGWAIQSELSRVDEHSAVLRPLLDSVGKADEARQLGPLVELVDRLQLPDGVLISHVFSAMLFRIASAAGKKGGEFHTPESITDLTAALLEPAPSDRILDPCCKAGGFLAAIGDELVRKGKSVDQLTVAISDYSTRSYALAYLNLRLRGIAPLILPNATERLSMGAPEDRYDIVTANPPFNISNWDDNSRFAGRWQFGIPPAHNANFAWLQYVVAALDRDGRAVVVMPQGASFSENIQEQNIRAAMLEDGVVSAVVALPGQMFNGTDIPVTLWLLRRSPASRPYEVLFVDATGLGSVQERGRRVLGGTDIDKIVETYRGWRQRRFDAVPGFAAGVPIGEVRDGGYRLNPRAYVAPIQSVPDLQTRARHAADLTQRLQQLSQQAAVVDQTIEAHLKEVMP
ncbi:class I SAM-dependent DNA methyltransferase [Catellatospora citrea]|uniref:HsdM family class I SAM-dependent methyltransferase n=1 Tax=Catellatospora citrea TaxID=53366 RepID=UPI0033F7DDE6